MSKGGAVDFNKELLDVIDEDDKVIGQMTKKDVHAGSNILHREIGILIYDKSGNMLLQQRSWKKKLFAGEWTISVIGHVLSGQTPEEAAHMELKEELGFDTELKFAERRLFADGNHMSYGFIFTGEFPRGVMISPDKDELVRAGFFKRDEVLKMIGEGKIGPHSALTIQNFLSGKYT
jgi:isopentenyl-diphosphate delta-isomerase type 1